MSTNWRVARLWITVLPIVGVSLCVAFLGDRAYKSYFQKYLAIVPKHIADSKGRNWIGNTPVSLTCIKSQDNIPHFITAGAGQTLQEVHPEATPSCIELGIALEKQSHNVALSYGGGWIALAERAPSGDTITLYRRSSDGTKYNKSISLPLNAAVTAMRFHWFKESWELLVGTDHAEIVGFSLHEGSIDRRVSPPLIEVPNVIGVSSNNQWMIVGAQNLQIFPMNRWERAQNILLNAPAQAITFLDNTSFAVSLKERTEVLIYSLTTPVPTVQILRGSPAPVLCLLYHARLNCLIAGDSTGNMTLWRQAKDQRFQTEAIQTIQVKTDVEKGHMNGISAMTASFDSQWVLSCGIRGSLYLWKADSLLRGTRLY